MGLAGFRDVELGFGLGVATTLLAKTWGSNPKWSLTALRVEKVFAWILAQMSKSQIHRELASPVQNDGRNMLSNRRLIGGACNSFVKE
jgi:hypothetical protein